MTQAQVSALHITRPGSVTQMPDGPACKWRPEDLTVDTSFTVTVLDKSHGLNGYYDGRASFPVFQPTEVGGYPAVNVDITDAKSGQCTTGVAVANGAGFSVSVHVGDEKSADYTNPCSVSSRLANTVLGNVKAGG
jgi:hypothetical protein